MKRGFALLFAAVFVMLASNALAQIALEGTIAGERTVSVLAPFGGIVEEEPFLAGDRVSKGDLIAVMRTTKVYSPADGTVAGVFGSEGDSTEGITERYGAVLFVEPVNKYTVSASTEKAYNLSDNKFVHIGETVYLSCTADGKHKGTGIVVSTAEDGKYGIEVTSGEFSMAEIVGVFRKANYAASSRIGRGTVSSAKSIAVKGAGSILKMHVKNGDSVERGELLFETVDGTLDGLYSPGESVFCSVDGIISTIDAASGSLVEKGAKLVSIYPDSALVVRVNVAESDLNSIREGMPVTVVFGWNPEQERRVEGTITRISYINGAESGEPTYQASVSIAPDKQARLGMSVIVYAEEELEIDEGEFSDDMDAELPDAAE